MKCWGLVSILVLAGCPHPKAPPEAPTTDACVGVAPKVNLAGEGDPDNHAAIDAIADACRRDAWSADLIACLDEQDDMKADDRCSSMMSETQHDDLEAAFEAGKSPGRPPSGGLGVNPYGTWDGEFTLALTDSSIHVDGDMDWQIEGTYTTHDDGTMTLDDPSALEPSRDACGGSMITGPLCEPPDLSCMKIDEVVGDTITISYGATCDHLDGTFHGARK